MYQLAWVLYNGDYQQVYKGFKTLKELEEWAKETSPGQEFVYRKMEGILTSMPITSKGGD